MDESQDQPATDRVLSVFWQDLAEDLQDPEFREAYIAESEHIARIDVAVNEALERGGDHPDFYGMTPEALADWVDRNSPPAGRS